MQLIPLCKKNMDNFYHKYFGATFHLKRNYMVVSISKIMVVLTKYMVPVVLIFHMERMPKPLFDNSVL